MRRNPELQHSTADAFYTLAGQKGGRRFVQNIYKYNSNITGNDTYWFQLRRGLIYQA